MMAEWHNSVLQGSQTQLWQAEHTARGPVHFSAAGKPRAPGSRPRLQAAVCSRAERGPWARLKARCPQCGSLPSEARQPQRVLEPGLAQGRQLARQRKACAAPRPGKAWRTERPCRGRSPALAPGLPEGTCPALAAGQQLREEIAW